MNVSIPIRVISVKRRRYILRRQLNIELAYLNNIVFTSNSMLPVSGYGSSKEEAMSKFHTAFDFQYRNLVEVPIETLTPGAIKARDSMQQVVENIEKT